MATPHIWYLSARAIREYLAMVGRRDDDGGPEWARAEAELHEWSHRVTATQPGTPTRSGDGSLVQYRGPRPLRAQLIVSRARREEGPLDQLVSVRPGSAAQRGTR